MSSQSPSASLPTSSSAAQGVRKWISRCPFRETAPWVVQSRMVAAFSSCSGVRTSGGGSGTLASGEAEDGGQEKGAQGAESAHGMLRIRVSPAGRRQKSSSLPASDGSFGDGIASAYNPSRNLCSACVNWLSRGGMNWWTMRQAVRWSPTVFDAIARSRSWSEFTSLGKVSSAFRRAAL